jgi:hypothetical protein
MQEQDTVRLILHSLPSLMHDLLVGPITWHINHRIYEGDLTQRLLRNYKLYFS